MKNSDGWPARNGDAAGNFLRPLSRPCSIRSHQLRSSHRRLTVDSRSPSTAPLLTKADAPTSKDRCLTSGSFQTENTMTLASGSTW